MTDRIYQLKYFSRWLLFVTWGVAVLWLSLMPSPPQLTSPLLGWDKLQHAGAYALLTFLAGWAFACFRADLKQRWLRAMAVAVLFGAIIEILQGVFTVNRTAEPGDLLADFIGAGAVALLAVLMARFGWSKSGR